MLDRVEQAKTVLLLMPTRLILILQLLKPLWLPLLLMLPVPKLLFLNSAQESSVLVSSLLNSEHLLLPMVLMVNLMLRSPRELPSTTHISMMAPTATKDQDSWLLMLRLQLIHWLLQEVEPRLSQVL